MDNKGGTEKWAKIGQVLKVAGGVVISVATVASMVLSAMGALSKGNDGDSKPSA